MPTSVRLDPEAERIVTRASRLSGKSKSQIIREAIRRFAREGGADVSRTVWRQLDDIIGVVNLGPGNRAARHEVILRKRFARRRGR